MGPCFSSLHHMDQILSLTIQHDELIVPTMTLQLMESLVEHALDHKEALPLSPQDLGFSRLLQKFLPGGSAFRLTMLPISRSSPCSLASSLGPHPGVYARLRVMTPTPCCHVSLCCPPHCLQGYQEVPPHSRASSLADAVR